MLQRSLVAGRALRRILLVRAAAADTTTVLSRSKRVALASSSAAPAQQLQSKPLLAKADGQADGHGSVYENYDEAAQIYDGIRHAGGVEVILGAFAAGATGTPLHEQKALDIGCGTGNYAAAIASHVGSLTCLDGNPSMLSKCQEKLEYEDTRARFVQGLLPMLPFDDNTFDSAMCNVVIHHIEDDTTRPTWANSFQLFQEAKRVLKPGGTLCINHITPEQVNAYWFLTYVPECRERWRTTLIPTNKMQGLLADAGLSNVRRTTPMDYVLFRPMEACTWRPYRCLWLFMCIVL